MNEASGSNQVENVRNREEPHLPSERFNLQEDHMVDLGCMIWLQMHFVKQDQ